MSFVHPALAFGVAIGVVPIIIHLLTRRRHKVVRWGAMKYLLAVIEENSRRVQIEDLILLALRVLTIVLLALTLARPIWSPTGSARPAEPRLAVLLIDNSPSMSSDRGGASRFDLARKWARQLIDELPANSEVAIVPMAGVAADGDAENPSPPIRDLGQAGRVIDELPLSASRADPGRAMRLAAKVLGNTALRNRSVFVLSDFQADDWSGAGGVAKDLRAVLADGVTDLVAVQCADERIDNAGISDVERDGRLFKTANAAHVFGTFVRRGYDGPATDHAATLYIHGGAGSPEVKCDTLTTKLDGKTPGRIDFDATLDRPGPFGLELRSPPDLMPADDSRFLAVDARDEVRVLLVDGDPHPEAPVRGETFFLRLALMPGPQARLPISPTVIPASLFDGENLDKYDLIVLANVGGIEPARAEAIAKAVRRGLPIVIFLGEKVDPANYNATLFGGETALAPIRLGGVVEAAKIGDQGAGAGGRGSGAGGRGGLAADIPGGDQRPVRGRSWATSRTTRGPAGSARRG